MPQVQILHRPYFSRGSILLVGAFVVIVLLTWVLVGMNVRAVVSQFAKDHNELRLYSYLVTLLILGSLIIGVASSVIQHVIDSENLLDGDNPSAIHYNRH
jgi:hypothetical protein